MVTPTHRVDTSPNILASESPPTLHVETPRTIPPAIAAKIVEHHDQDSKQSDSLSVK
jgi:hypothetical protein